MELDAIGAENVRRTWDHRFTPEAFAGGSELTRVGPDAPPFELELPQALPRDPTTQRSVATTIVLPKCPPLQTLA
jgi:hypothetical protein